MAGKKKSKKKEEEELLAPDAFMETAGAGSAWFEKNFKLVIGGVVVVLAVVLGVQVLSQQGSREKAAVTTELNDAVDAYREATDLQTVLTSTAPETLKKGYREAADELAAIRAQHPGTPAARIAAVYQGDLARRLDDYDRAVELFEAYLLEAPKDAPLRFFALEGAGYALEAKGDLDGALAKFTQLAEAHDFYEDYALKHKARVLEAKGDSTGAVAAYQAIADMDPASPLKSFAENRLKALQ